MEDHRLLHLAGLEQGIEILGSLQDGCDLEHTGSREAAAQRQRRLIGRRIDDGKADVVDVGADRETEEDDLHDRQRQNHGQRPRIAADVLNLLAQQAEQRSHAGLASWTNRSSIDETANCCFNSAGVPSAPIRPATMIEMRSQYSASSM